MITILRTLEAIYEDDSYIVEYTDENGKIGYEMVDDYDEDIEPKENKILIEDTEIDSEILDLIDTENGVVYLYKSEYEEEGLLEDYKELVEKLENIISKHNCLDIHIEIWENEDDEHIVLYQSLITELLFDREFFSEDVETI